MLLLLGFKITPSHGRKSIVTALRIYTANNNPNADPIAYRLQGRDISGANVRTRYASDICWDLDLYQVVMSSCDSEKQSQRFYMTSQGEIKNKALPGYCMDARYVRLEKCDFIAVVELLCHSWNFFWLLIFNVTG